MNNYMNRRQLLQLYRDADLNHKKNRLSDLEYIRVITRVHNNIGGIHPTWLKHPAMIIVFPLLPFDWLYQKCYDKYLKKKIKKELHFYAYNR